MSEDIASWQYAHSKVDPLGLSRQQRVQSEAAAAYDLMLSKWNGKIHTDGRGEPFIVIDGAAVRLPSSLAAFYSHEEEAS